MFVSNKTIRMKRSRIQIEEKIDLLVEEVKINLFMGVKTINKRMVLETTLKLTGAMISEAKAAGETRKSMRKRRI
jgi:uncharacterized protein with PhoU and TrkA domain